jgi:excinuclease ABC subunit C
LLKTFKSVKNIQQKSMQELTDIVGASKAKIVFNYFAEKVPV